MSGSVLADAAACQLTDAGRACLCGDVQLPSLLFYILLGLVYAPIAPLLLPFLLLFLVIGSAPSGQASFHFPQANSRASRRFLVLAGWRATPANTSTELTRRIWQENGCINNPASPRHA